MFAPPVVSCPRGVLWSQVVLSEGFLVAPGSEPLAFNPSQFSLSQLNLSQINVPGALRHGGQPRGSDRVSHGVLTCLYAVKLLTHRPNWSRLRCTSQLRPCSACGVDGLECASSYAGSFNVDMGLTASQDALLNLPQSQPEHVDNAGNTANGEHGQQEGQVIRDWLPVKRSKRSWLQRSCWRLSVHALSYHTPPLSSSACSTSKFRCS
jgi:hypothetical protein